MVKLLASVTELETEKLRPFSFRLPVVRGLPGRVQGPKRQVVLRPAGLCVSPLGLPVDRQDHPQKKEWTLLLEVVLRPVDLCVCRLGLPARRQDHPQRMDWTLPLEVLCAFRAAAGSRRRRVGPGLDSGLPAQIHLSVCPLEAASRAELLWVLHQPAESLRVAHPVFLCALFRALLEMVKPEPLPERTLARLAHLAEAAGPACPFVYLVQMA